MTPQTTKACNLAPKTTKTFEKCLFSRNISIIPLSRVIFQLKYKENYTLPHVLSMRRRFSSQCTKIIKGPSQTYQRVAINTIHPLTCQFGWKFGHVQQHRSVPKYPCSHRPLYPVQTHQIPGSKPPRSMHLPQCYCLEKL
jgi:hypothetical protein